MSDFAGVAMHALHATFVAWAVAYVGLACAVLAGFERDAPRRLAAVCVFATAVPSALFHVLAAFGLFTRGPASLALAVVAGVLHLVLRRRGARPVADIVRCDLRRVARIARVLLRSRRALVFGLLALIVLVVASRVLQSPPLAWDALTYHAVKPALWLQSGGDLPLDAPGGWSSHRGRLPGAEIVAAWAMLPGPGDAFWGCADLFFWLALASGLQMLGRAFALRARERGAVVVFGCFLPVVFLSVGSGYVELPLAALLALSLGLLLHARSARHGGAWLAGTVGIALLAGMKLMAWPAAAVLAFFALAELVRGPFGAEPGRASRGASAIGPSRGRAFAWGALAFVAIACPAPLRQFLATGYPLSVPLRIGPITLGAANAELAHLETLAGGTAHGWQAEASAVGWFFGDPLRIDPHFTITGAVALALALVGAALALRARPDARARVLWTLAPSAALLVAWFSPDLETVRLHWARSNARHWMPIALPLLPLAFAHARTAAAPAPRRVRWGSDLMLAAAVFHGVVCVAWGWPAGFAAHGLAGAAILLVAAVTVVHLATRPDTAALRGTTRLWLATGAITLALAAATLAARTPDARWRWYEGGMTFGWTPRYWVPAARHLSEREGPLRIAVTSGPHPPADGWFMQPLLGRTGEHRLFYVPVTDSPLPRALAPGYGRDRDARFERWNARLDEARIDYVMAFWPTRLELEWMKGRPDRFVRIDGDAASWGLYRVIRP